MKTLKEQLQLTDEQFAILQDIRNKLDEFKATGGLIAYDYDECCICALNAKNLRCKFSEVNYLGSPRDDNGFQDVSEYLQLAPFQFYEIGGYYTVVADVSMYKNDNLF